MQYFLIFCVFCILNILIWVSTNWQLVNGASSKTAYIVCALLSLPISFLAFYATKISYEALDSLWSVRLLGFGMSYLIFPVMTWVFLHETPFNFKTSLCILLSIIIILIQIFLPNN